MHSLCSWVHRSQLHAIVVSAPVNSPPGFWADSFHLMTDEGHLEVLKALVELVAPPVQSPKPKEARQFLHFLNKPNRFGQTSLMLACKSG